MSRFDRVIVADWSAAASPSPARPSANAIWLGIAGPDGITTSYFRTRAAAETAIAAEITANRGRLLIGFDFPMGYPAGFAAGLTGQTSARAVWRWLAENLSDSPDNRNNRFALAAGINTRFPAAAGPFWGRPASLPLPALPATKAVDYPALGLAERRLVEGRVPRAQPVWKLYTTGAAGAQGLVGQAMIHRLGQLSGVVVWPFDPTDAPVVLAEVYPSLLARAVAADPAPIRDEVQVRLLARALWHLSQTGGLEALLREPPDGARREEGWILGAGQVAALEAAL